MTSQTASGTMPDPTGDEGLEPPSTDEPPPAAGAEAVLIDRLRRATAIPAPGLPPEVLARVGIGDDAAVLPGETVWTLDVLVEGEHFDDRLSPVDVGFKAVAVSVSDAAAMGARPTWLLLGLSVPARDDAFVDGVTEGVALACARFGVQLVGGDTTRSRRGRVLTSVVGGRLMAAPLLRSAGRPGQLVGVTGTLGLAGVGWSTEAPPAHALDALRRPAPPVAFAVALAENGLGAAAMDLSDGLGLDLDRLCEASGCGARIDSHALPIGEGACVRTATRGGDDYQLLFTIEPEHRDGVESLAHDLGVRVSWVGELVDGRDVLLDGGAFPPLLFSHFEDVS